MVLLAVLSRGIGWRVLGRVWHGVLLVVYDWYVVGKCCGRMVWHMVLVVVCEWMSLRGVARGVIGGV